MKFSKYKTHHEKDNITINMDQYIELTRNGDHQSIIFNARANKNDKKLYSEIKSQLPAITGSCTMKQNKRALSNIDEMNGLILLDIDDDVDTVMRKQIDSDKYTFVSNRSVGGTGLCVFVKIAPELFLESFYQLAQYFADNFGLDIDPACKDKGRLRYLSYDLDVFHNEKALTFKAKKAKAKKQKKETFYFVEDDFGHIMSQIKDRGIDLCEDDYKKFVEIGFAIGGHFGVQGLDYFKTICQNGSKYEPDKIERQYAKFCKPGGISISTFYYYCQEKDIELYSDKSIDIIKRVAVGKANSTKMTPESVRKTLEVLGTTTTDKDDDFIQKLIDSKENLVKKIDNEDNETVKLETFIKENYPIIKNDFNQIYEYEGEAINDEVVNSITIHAKKYFDFKVSSTDVSQLIFNSKAKSYDPLKQYFIDNNIETTGNEIKEYSELIKPLDFFNEWALKKWLVGAVHNWISPYEHEEVSPLVLVLCGKQASGKTSFFRNMLPKELRKYFIDEAMEEGGKDVLKRMAISMIMLNDEFGGMAAKDVKNFKKITEKNRITIRLPYGRLDVYLKRRTMLCGTTNDKAVLKDETGNRRILPIEFEGVDYEAAKNFDKDKLLKCAYDLYKSGYDFRIYSKEDMQFLDDCTVKNVEINPVEELFFTKFSFENEGDFSERVIMNQGEICEYMSLKFSFKVSKYDIRNIFLKHKAEMKTYRISDKTKKGYELFMEDLLKSDENMPY